MKLWNRNFTLLMAATLMGAMGGIAGGFALSFLVFDETGSTLASALIVVIQLVPAFLVPLIFAPRMDHLPRKPFLVAGDALNGVIYAALGVYLLVGSFSYIGYLCVSIVLACLSSFDELAYNSIFPMLIPKGREQKGLRRLVHALSDPEGRDDAAFGRPARHAGRSGAADGAGRAVAAGGAHGEPHPPGRAAEARRANRSAAVVGGYSRDGAVSAQGARPAGDLQLYGCDERCRERLCADSGRFFFRTFPGMTALMYSLFSVAEFFGRTLGGAVQYRTEIPPKKKNTALPSASIWPMRAWTCACSGCRIR